MRRNSPKSAPSKFHKKFSRPYGSRFGKSNTSSFSGNSSNKRSFSAGRRNFPSRGRKSSLNLDTFINKATTTSDVGEFKSKHQFTDFGLDESLTDIVIKKGYSEPTPIQDKVIPQIMSGKDVVGLANTGTGKTAAFLLPLIHKLINNRSERVIVLVPTRELALQINQEFRSFAPRARIRSAVCVGGMNIQPQIRTLRQNCQLVIGTPGRTIDLINRRVLKLDNINTIVLDEADAMLDMGFINDMRFVINKMPRVRHTLFFSATMSPTIKKLVDEFLTDPITISVKTQDSPSTIQQDVVRLNGRARVDVLTEILTDPEFKKVLVFGRTKHGVEKLSNILVERGIKAGSIHGNKSHGFRQRSLQKFKQGYTRVLVATDVAARGLDIDNVSHVINYELPENYDDYIHRIGRTGRGTQKGMALTFV